MYPSWVRTMPLPMPLVGWPKGEKPSAERPFAVIVTTLFCAWATTAVRSMFWTVVELVVRAAPGSVVTTVRAGTSSVTASAVPPAASVALRAAAARTVPMPRPDRRVAGRSVAVGDGDPGDDGEAGIEGACGWAGGSGLANTGRYWSRLGSAGGCGKVIEPGL